MTDMWKFIRISVDLPAGEYDVFVATPLVIQFQVFIHCQVQPDLELAPCRYLAAAARTPTHFISTVFTTSFHSFYQS